MNDVATSEAVSSNDETLILVNKQDDPVGRLDKGSVHDGDGILHRAFSVFLFNSKGEVLLQQRAAGKRLWPGYWSNSCCSHPRWGEGMSTAVARRLAQELGLKAQLEYLYKFIYRAHFGHVGSEYELCWVYAGFCDEQHNMQVNALEIDDWRWLASSALTGEIAENPDGFTPWMKQEWQQITTQYQDRLADVFR